MAIYDCFQFFDEEHILDLRLRASFFFVDFFVFVKKDRVEKIIFIYFVDNNFFPAFAFG